MLAEDFVGLPPAQAVAAIRSRVPVLPSTYYADMPGAYRQFAFSIAGIAALDTIQGVMNDLGDALRDGRTFADWKREAVKRPELAAMSANRLDTIFRTNIQGAYHRGIYERQREVEDQRPFLMYDAVNDARTRPNHLAMDNYIARADDPIWATHRPPMGYRCRCTLIALTEGQARARGLGTVPRPTVDPDPGWAYDRAEGIGPGIERATTSRAQACDLGRGELWCSGHGETMLQRYELANARSTEPPAPRAPPDVMLPAGEPRRVYEHEFDIAIGPDKVDLGPSLVLTELSGMFTVHDARGRRSQASAIEGASRGPYVRWIAAATRDPDEVWIEDGEHGVMLRVLTTYVPLGGLVPVSIVQTFRRRSGEWVGWGAYATTRAIERLRSGVILYQRGT